MLAYYMSADTHRGQTTPNSLSDTIMSQRLKFSAKVVPTKNLFLTKKTFRDYSTIRNDYFVFGLVLRYMKSSTLRCARIFCRARIGSCAMTRVKYWVLTHDLNIDIYSFIWQVRHLQ